MSPQEAFDQLCEKISKACAQAHRKVNDVQLLPVSKGQDLEKLKEFLSLKDFPKQLAENYLLELSQKEAQLSEVEWHYQGALQSRKIEDVLNHATYVQSVSRIKELQLIQKLMSVNEKLKFKGFYLQINISTEGQKLGASQDEAIELLNFVHTQKLEKLFKGFMGIASELGEGIAEAEVRKQFSSLRAFRDKEAPQSKLSMGMSGDFDLAIAEGADLVRVGSLLFGQRK